MGLESGSVAAAGAGCPSGADAVGAGAAVNRTRSAGASARRSCQGQPSPGSPRAESPKVRLNNAP